MRRERKANWIWLVLAVPLLAFIWGNSILSVAQSTSESRWVLNLVTPFLERFVGAGNVTDHLVRKIAHFVEFAALGFVLFWLFRWLGGRASNASSRGGIFGGSSSRGAASGGRVLLNAALIAFFTGFFDETIQVFTGRGALIKDVWLDFAGSAFGILIAGLIGLFVRGRSER